jgi:hydrogenase nickel incorporation protein HypB
MCTTCGCGNPEEPVQITVAGQVPENQNGHYHHSHDHHHGHDHQHRHSHTHMGNTQQLIELEADILQGNNLLAERNRGYFEALGVLAINLVSAPGSGKTTILEETIKSLKNELPVYVIEGDQQTLNDANRIKSAGAPAIQVNTGMGCHLDADMINKAMKKLEIKGDSFLFIENVGNLVCPSMFDLGETKRVVIMSTTEGEDKPLKYPNMFETSHVCLINKIDLLPYVNYDLEKAKLYALKVNHHLEFIEMSATTGDGMQQWIDWLKQQLNKLKTS